MFKLNVIEPHLLETNGEERFSINDVETVERLFRKAREDDAQTQAAPTVEAPPSQEERDPDARDRRRALQDYLESGKSPCDLPVWFWEIPDPIPFVPPLDVFRYEYAARRFDEKPRDFITHIKRSAGYSRNNEGKVVRVLEDPAFSVELDLHPAGVGPAQFEHQNLMYELARQDWYEQVRLHGLGTSRNTLRPAQPRHPPRVRSVPTNACETPCPRRISGFCKGFPRYRQGPFFSSLIVDHPCSSSPATQHKSIDPADIVETDHGVTCGVSFSK
jgi:hypothetical protein